jgi:hypothetical protein
VFLIRLHILFSPCFFETLELDVSIEEIENALEILKPIKSPGQNGIISEFYITHWEQIKDEFFLLLNDILFSPCFFTSSKKYRVDLSPSSAHFILERIFAASAFCV